MSRAVEASTAAIGIITFFWDVGVLKPSTSINLILQEVWMDDKDVRYIGLVNDHQQFSAARVAYGAEK